MRLSPDQQTVYTAMLDWITGAAGEGRILTMGGLAGTGKTTLLGVLAAHLQYLQLQVAYVSFTGRASAILGRKLKAQGVETTDGLMPDERARQYGRGSRVASLYDYSLTDSPGDPALCGTLHRLLYSPIINDRDELLGWTKRDTLDRHYDLLVIDEASMVGDAMLEDLRRHGVPILAVGDHGQLPPVMDTGALMRNPDLRLEQIHRQAGGNPIIALAHHVRETGRIDRTLADGERIVVASKRSIEQVLKQAYAAAKAPLDVGVLCWTNKNRISLNSYARRALGHKGVPKAGETVIVLRNDPPRFNGMRGILEEDTELDEARRWILYGRVGFPEEGLPTSAATMCAATFNRERPFKDLDEVLAAGIKVKRISEAGHPYDFGYALTVHKSQGSQFEHAVVYLDRPERRYDEDYRRWLYTAVTRASNKLTLVMA